MKGMISATVKRGTGEKFSVFARYITVVPDPDHGGLLLHVEGDRNPESPGDWETELFDGDTLTIKVSYK